MWTRTASFEERAKMNNHKAYNRGDWARGPGSTPPTTAAEATVARSQARDYNATSTGGVS